MYMFGYFMRVADSFQTAQSDQSLHWANVTFCWLYHALALAYHIAAAMRITFYLHQDLFLQFIITKQCKN